MLIGVLQFELLIRGAESLKDKRRVIRSLKDRLHREHMVSIAEVDGQNRLNVAVLACAVVSASAEHANQTLDKIVSKLRRLTEAEVGATAREIVHGQQVFAVTKEDVEDLADGPETEPEPAGEGAAWSDVFADAERAARRELQGGEDRS